MAQVWKPPAATWIAGPPRSTGPIPPELSRLGGETAVGYYEEPDLSVYDALVPTEKTLDPGPVPGGRKRKP